MPEPTTKTISVPASSLSQAITVGADGVATINNSELAGLIKSQLEKQDAIANQDASNISVGVTVGT